MIILGVDPSLRSTGFGVIEAAGNAMRGLTFGEIKNKPSVLPSRCLVRIHDQIRDCIASYKPDAFVVEGIIFVQSTRVAITMGHARAAAILAAAEAGLPVFEYAPRKVKAAVTGLGGAGKQQVGRMVRVLLGLPEVPPPDAADALAVAICHAQSSRGIVVEPANEI
ncbi:MAG: crossover junction endodeoxyribonuclease RuvC [Verrucomicrobia bacterium]|nr:crossover junction endodeoxyribonuclease RuvC [Verrucomicrobiota bacterium]